MTRHPELERAWTLGRLKAQSEEHMWLVSLGDGQGQQFPIGEAANAGAPSCGAATGPARSG